MKLNFSGLRILVIGDPMYDYYYFGRVDRISPEAPVPVFIELDADCRAGGAANVARQLVFLGVQVTCAWTDNEWTAKHRYLVGSHQLFRIDNDRYVPNVIPPGPFDAIVISDYAKGACTPEICRQAIAMGIPVIVDPKGKDWEKYRGCALICPNHLEINGNEGFNIIEKRGALGLRYNGIDYPSTAKRVYDVTGAGDVVVSIIAACVADEITLPVACQIANLAAGYAVEQVGTSVCSLEVLQSLVDDAGISEK